MESAKNRLAFAIGASAAITPLVDPWALLFFLPYFVLCGYYHRGLLRLILLSVGALALFATLIGTLDPTLALVSLSVTLLLTDRTARVFVVPLAISQLSIYHTSIVLLSQAIEGFGLEPAAPCLGLLILWWSVTRRTSHLALLALSATILLTLISAWLGLSPLTRLFVASLPLIAVILLGPAEQTSEIRSCTAVLLACAAVLISWIIVPPRIPSSVYTYLPDVTDSYSNQFFKNYPEALAFVGLNIKRTQSLEEIPIGATLLLPWLTDALPHGEEDERALRQLADERYWTVIMLGEHTNLGGVADRISSISGLSTLRSDLSVPPNNSDFSGPLRVAGPSSWRTDAVLNRGATVEVTSPLDRVLLQADGWFADRDLQEWLWVGNYRWEFGDRAGRIPLMTLVQVHNARWVTIGDNSFALNEQVLADPRPLAQVLALSTLLPSILLDFIVLTFLGLSCFPVPRWAALTATPIALFGAIASQELSASPSPRWNDIYVHENGFSPSNFSRMLAQSSELLTFKDLRLMRVPRIIFDDPAPGGVVVKFGLTEGLATVNKSPVQNCRRIGNVRTDEGPLVMDGEACTVSSEAKVLLGTQQAAAAFSMSSDSGVTLYILDRQFLSQGAPRENLEWLLKKIQSARQATHTRQQATE